MRLADFILANREPILAEWEEFARTCLPASEGMNIAELRDHANDMLTVIAADLSAPQGGWAQSEKSKGRAPAVTGRTAATRHGADRAESGFSTGQMVSEYRALRASVIRLWAEAEGAAGPDDLEDLTRFNEAIDQALAESIVRYTTDLDNSKEMFLAMLGHDLRTPIGAVMTSAQFILETDTALEEPSRGLMSRIASSAKRMNHMVGTLLDFTRSRLGGGIPIERAPMNMGQTALDVTGEVLAAHPDRSIEVDARGDLDGEWDCERVSQVLTNLIANALEHGSADTPVRVEVRGNDADVIVSVHNRGPAIPRDRLARLFDPMKTARGAGSSGGTSGGLGLGLYIAERIVNAHRGAITVKSDEDETVFTVKLPRRV